jgi:hypothetical protein
MNSSTNSTTTTANSTDVQQLPSLDTMLTAFGDIIALDYMWFYPFVILGPIGFLANILCFVVLLNKKFDNMPMYSYLRVYTVNSGLLCLLSIPIFVASARRLFPALNCYASQIYFLWVYLPCGISMQVMAPLLDIAITMDRIGFFNPRVKALMARTSPRILCPIFFFISSLNGALYYAQTKPFGIPVGSVLDTSTGQVIPNLVIWAQSGTAFAKSDFGTVFFTVYLFARESILLVGEIVPNCVSLYYLKGYYSKKIAHVAKENRLPNTADTKRTQSTSPTTFQNTATGAVVAARADQVIERVAAQQMADLSQADRNATVMALILCSLSMVTHTVTIGVNVYGLLGPNNLIASSLVSQIFGYATSEFFFNSNYR